MRVMVIVKANAETEGGALPEQDMLEQMGAYNQQLVDAGIMQGVEGLHPSSKGKRVKFSGTQRTVIDGPFAETKELIAGFWLWQVKDWEDAVEWAKRCPNPTGGESMLELRQVGEAEDFGEACTPEIREQGEKMRATLEARAKK